MPISDIYYENQIFFGSIQSVLPRKILIMFILILWTPSPRTNHKKYCSQILHTTLVVGLFMSVDKGK